MTDPAATDRIATDHTDRFAAGASDYDRFRPRYPAALMAVVAGAVMNAAGEDEEAGMLDVGSGSGIFTRQLRSVLPGRIGITGVEPSADMRRQASEACEGQGIVFVEGTAETLPATDAGVVAVTAGTSAHWFDRRAFYADVRRVLRPGGVLAIVEYMRDVEGSPPARAIVDFLDAHGEPRLEGRPDYLSELSALDGFDNVGMHRETVTLSLSIDEFTGLALSSSYARPAIARLGRSGAEAAVAGIAKPHVDAGGRIPLGYLFQAFIARRKG
jgi:ubiquinone/menaquinone biosynthesis C-methylase UbiE